MVDMSVDEKDEQYFITNIEHTDEEIIITYADGRVTREPFREHNLNFYRSRMIDQANQRIEGYLDTLSFDCFLPFAKRTLAIIGGVISLFFLYNVDIHLIMKIILTILITLGELGYYLYTELYLMVLNDEAIEGMATDYYLKHLDKFREYVPELGEDHYIVPIEDIGTYKLSKEMLEDMSGTIDEFKKMGSETQNIRLVYKRKTEEPEQV